MNKERNASYWIKKLNLEVHPEGGYFKELYRSNELIKQNDLPKRYDEEHCFFTSVYFLLEGKQISHFHKSKSDEILHFYDGSSLTVHFIDEKGKLIQQKVGLDVDKGELPQYLVPKNCWFCLEVDDKQSFTLLGCTVSPGFLFADFELGNKTILIKRYPDYKSLIEKFTIE
jgi:hypothetical protein